MNPSKILLPLGIFCLLTFSCTPSTQEQRPATPGDKTTQSADPSNPGNTGTESTDPGSTDPESTDPGSFEPDFSAPDWYDTFFWDRTDRQKAGIRGPVKSTHLRTPIYTNDRYNIYTFDEAGHLLKEEHKQIDTDVYNHSLTYSYDDKGRRIKMEYKQGNVTNGYTCEYENGDRYVAVSGYNWIHMYGVYVGDGNGYANGQDLVGIMKGLSAVHFATEEEFWYDYAEYKYEFDEDGNLTITVTDTYGQEKDKLSTETTIWYVTYENGLPVSSTRKKGDGVPYTEIEKVEWQANGLPAKLVMPGGETYEYEENGRTVLVKKHYGYTDWGGMRGEEYFYDEHFDLVQRDLDVNDEAYGIHHDNYTEYKYDRYGNWTSRKEALTPIFWDGTEAGKSANTVLQVIEYFE